VHGQRAVDALISSRSSGSDSGTHNEWYEPDSAWSLEKLGDGELVQEEVEVVGVFGRLGVVGLLDERRRCLVCVEWCHANGVALWRRWRRTEEDEQESEFDLSSFRLTLATT
jgi:hypothetical protein